MRHMNYWLTTHWPPLVDEPDYDPTNIYLPNGRQQAGRNLRPGDRVLIYQSLTGRTVIKHDLEDREYRVRSRRGRQGIVVIAEVDSKLTEDTDSEPTDYSDGSRIWWRWRARTETLSTNGFVPMRTVNKILGYRENHNFHGFGDYKSGLKKLEPQQYLDLVAAFRRKPRSMPSVRKLLRSRREHAGGRREVAESKDHKLLKEYVAAAPVAVLGEAGLKTLAVEFSFPTGDRADLVLEDEVGRIVGLEVEVSVGPDQIEGVLQAIKYRFMLALMKERTYEETRAFLVAHSLSPAIKRICRAYDVEYFTVNISDVQQWVQHGDRN